MFRTVLGPLVAMTLPMMAACGREAPAGSADAKSALTTTSRAQGGAPGPGPSPSVAVATSDVEAPASPPVPRSPPEIPDPEHHANDVDPEVVVTADPESVPSIAPAPPSAPLDDGFDLRQVHTGLGDPPEGSTDSPKRPAPDGLDAGPESTVDPYWSARSDDTVPDFPEDDPLLTAGIPVCRALVEGLKACLPKLEGELADIINSLAAGILNSARALRRPHVRLRACEMGWSSLPDMLEKYCPGSFDPSIPRSTSAD